MKRSELLTVHSLTWLFAGNVVGLLLASLLLFPGLGALLEPFSYGRLIPVHFNLQLYGWCSLPLIGLLFEVYLPRSGTGRLPRLAIGIWSGSLLFGAISWAVGHSSGKLFLEWSGLARGFLAANLAFLGLVLAVSFTRQVLSRRTPGLGGPLGAFAKWTLIAKGVLLAGLLAVPALMYWAAGPSVYPPINPDSGGATGGSLLGSTLGIVAIIFICPLAVGMKPADGGRAAVWTAAALALHFAWFGVLDHGDRSHHEIVQILSLASLAIWIPLLTRHLRRFAWPEESRRWLAALCAWSGLLLATGLVAFLPGVLERWKFTNALVAHAHVAMAGLVTCFSVIILNQVNRGTPLGSLFAGRPAFYLWHAGCLVLVVSLLVLGTIEGTHPGIMFRFGSTVAMLYAVRWLGGAMMALASYRWLAAALEVSRPKTAIRPTGPAGEPCPQV
ncbi:MAG: hypothetical protein GY719_32760 [bacterium]|nr:hypothetical protein [bacterium]